VLAVLWTSPSGIFMGSAGPAIGTGIENGAGGNTVVTLGHDWSQWIGSGWPIQEGDGPGAPRGPITGTEVYYAITDTEYSMEELDSTLYNDPSITWNPLSNFLLSYGDSTTYNLGNLLVGDVVLFRFMASGEGETSEEMVQYVVVAQDIPTLPEWGMIILTVLLLATAVWLMRKRKARMTPA
jgi:hypothetical protein